jgi:hypothetical protein
VSEELDLRPDFVRTVLGTGWPLVRGVEPGIYEADTSSDGYYLNLIPEPGDASTPRAPRRTIWDPHEALARAEALARDVHDAQVDKAGRPYVEHLRRVCYRVGDDPWDATIAWLHDIVEDTDVTPDGLRALGFPSFVVEAVVLLTRIDGQPYRSFISNIQVAAQHEWDGYEDGNTRARRVKIADLLDNLDPRRGHDDPSLRERYVWALDHLLHGDQVPTFTSKG